MVTLKNVLGIVGLAVIALFWVVITGSIYGGLFVAVLIVVVAVVLRHEQTRKRPEPEPRSDGAADGTVRGVRVPPRRVPRGAVGDRLPELQT